ncbi:MAG: endoribonuclease L-PSP [Parabacteroides sp.]
MVNALLAQVSTEVTPLRLTFFGRPSSNAMYAERWKLLRQKVAARFGVTMPALSYVAQPPLDAPLLLELYGCRLQEGERLTYGATADISYVVWTNDVGRFLFTGGFRGEDLTQTTEQQAEQAFQHLEETLRETGFPPDSILRQWNYIEGITAFADTDQHYQAFNNVRSAHYGQTQWPTGYPAATGIGTHFGGVSIAVDAALLTASDAYVTPIDNRLQVAAHAYSGEVLEVANQRKSTPKFERAKRLTCGKEELIYVSGTAAIRGEGSLKQAGLARQLEVTMENIKELIGSAPLVYLRVYLKNPADYAEAACLLAKYALAIPITFMWADVCREELLIEIEGLAKEIE